MNHFELFQYVDGSYEHRVANKFQPWTRMLAREVNKSIVERARRTNCFMSVQRFKDAISNRKPKEEDTKKQPPQKKNGKDHKEVVDAEKELEPDLFLEQQVHYHGLYFDFDADPTKLGMTETACLALAKEEAARVAQHIHQRFQLPDPLVQCWFSGRKGFHVLVRPEVFDIQPHNNLSYIVQKVALDLINDLELKTLDRTVYSIPRMWRIANTIHQTTGRFKVELTINELVAWAPQKILETATNPRSNRQDDYVLTGVPASHLWGEDEYIDLVFNPDAALWWQEYVSQYEAAKELKNLAPRKKIEKPTGSDDYPVCVKDIMDNGPKPGSPGRNRVLLPLVAFMKDAGLAKPTAHDLVKGWTQQHFSAEGSKIRLRQANGRSVIESVYRSPLYAFSCASMLSNKGVGPEGRIACQGDECPWVGNKNDQIPAAMPSLHLAEASRSAYKGVKVQIAVHVSGIGKAPYFFPMKVRLQCELRKKGEEEDYCSGCPNKDEKDGRSEKIFSAADRHILSFIDVNDPRKAGALKSAFSVPKKCFQHVFEELETGNVEQVQLIPMVDYANAYAVNPDTESNPNKFATKHVVSNAYYLGHGITANKKYMIDCYPYDHPESQEVVFQFEKAEAAQNDIDQFKMTPDLYRQLLIFQKESDQTVDDKLKEIHDDLETNVYRIRGRQDIAIAVDLCYHSVIGFKFQGNFINKGWFELLVVGDSGTGKTTIVERLMNHFGLGELIAGEEAKRTGLVYSAQQISGNWVVVWGKLPQNDRRLLVIDEFGAIPEEEIGKLTQLRSEGKARGQGVAANYETWARTRLILISNPKNGRSLKETNYGIEAIRDLFVEHQDLRRTDWALTAKTEEVAENVINTDISSFKKDHRYTADLCRQLVLWIWSRDPHHVEFVAGAEQRILWWAEVMGRAYTCDIYLADRSDLRLKIARVACSVAARLFSTDSKAEKLIVTSEHVDAAAKRMDASYHKPSMALSEYARAYQAANQFDQHKTKKVKTGLENFPMVDHLVASLLSVNYFTKHEMLDLTGYDKDTLDTLWRFFIKNQLIRKFTKGYKKTPAFTEHLKSMNSVVAGYGTPPEAPTPPDDGPEPERLRMPGDDDDDPTPLFTRTGANPGYIKDPDDDNTPF